MFSFQDAHIDGDHDQIIGRFSELYGTLCWDPAQQDRHLDLLQELQAYISEHFDREEAVMAAQGFEGLQAHVDAHQVIRQGFADLLGNLQSPEYSLEERLTLMRDVFLAHIVVWDDAYGAWLSQQAPDLG